MSKKILFARLSAIVFVFCALIPSCTSGAKKGAAKTVNVATWSNYLSPEVIAAFEKQTGIRVQVSNYSSNEELLAKLQAGASGYDVAFPSDYMVFAMIQLGLLNSLDKSQIPALKGVDSKFLGKPFDPSNAYAVPYDWGTTGIAINRDRFKGKVRGWKDVFGNPELKGKFTLLDDVRETLGAALKATGASLNSTLEGDLSRAKELLLKHRSAVKAFTSEPTVPLAQGETWLAHAYVSDTLQARKQSGGKIDYVIPEEGCTLWIDHLVIPKGAEHVEEAHAFIEFLLQPKNAVQTTLSVFVSPTVPAVMSLLPAALARDPALFPTATQLAKCEMMQDLGVGLTAWDRIWTELKAQRD